MEEAPQIVFSIIALAIGILIIMQVISFSNDQQYKSFNNQAIKLINDKCEFVCSLNTYAGQIATIELATNSLLYTRENKICYSYKQYNKCEICSCPYEIVDEEAYDCDADPLIDLPCGDGVSDQCSIDYSTFEETGPPCAGGDCVSCRIDILDLRNDALAKEFDTRPFKCSIVNKAVSYWDTGAAAGEEITEEPRVEITCQG